MSIDISLEAHQKEIEEWRKKRITNLTKEDSWLTLCGLFWLEDGENKIGSDPSNSVILPNCPSFIGSLHVKSSNEVTLEQNGSIPLFVIQGNERIPVTSNVNLKHNGDTSSPTVVHVRNTLTTANRC